MEIKLLGTAKCMRADGAVLSFRSSMALEVVAYLATHRSGATRKQLARAIWPDLAPDRQAHNLRQNLLYVRKVEEGLLTDRGGRLVLDESALVDVEIFRRAAASTSENGLRMAIDIYRGPFMADSDSEWSLSIRDELSEEYVVCLLRLIDMVRRTDLLEAIRLSELAIAADPLREHPRLTKVEALVALGERAKAVESLESYRSLLRTELGIDVSPQLVRAAGLEPAKASAKAFNRSSLSPLYRLQFETSRMPEYLQSGRLADGRRRLKDALDSGVANGEERSRALTALSRLDFEVGEYSTALSHAEAAERLANYKQSLLMARLGIARSHFGLGRFEVAQPIVDGILKQVSADELDLRAEALQLAGLLAYIDHRPIDAVSLAKRGLRLAEKAESPYLRMTCLNLMGSSFFKQGKTADGLTYLTQALKIADAHAMTLRSAHLVASIGRVEESEGKIDQAWDHYMRSYKLFEGGESPVFQAITGTYLADVALRRGDVESGLKWHKVCLAVRRKAGDRLGLVTSIRGVGRALLMAGQYREARELLRQALRTYESLGDEFGCALALVPLARCEAHLGLRPGALLLLERAEEIIARYSDRIGGAYEREELTSETLVRLRQDLKA